MATPNPTPENHTGQPADWAITYCPERNRFLIPKALNTMSAVYLIENTVTGQRYVGSSASVGRRIDKHLHHTSTNPVITQDMKAHGRQSFLASILEVTLRDMLPQREGFWISQIRPECNRSSFVGTSGSLFSKESRAKISAANARRRHSEDTKSKLRLAMVGRRPPMVGRNHTDETRAKMSAAQKGRPQPPEQIAAQREGIRRANERKRWAFVWWLVMTRIHKPGSMTA